MDKMTFWFNEQEPAIFRVPALIRFRLIRTFFLVFVMDKMVARKTIVSLVWYLLIGWAVWIIVNFIEKTVSA